MISVTDLAAEKISKAQEGQDMNGKMLRIGVYSAGCSGGYQYALGFDAKSDDDSMFESNGLEVIVKSEDVEKVNGTEIDYVISEMGEGFRVNNPNPAPEGVKGQCNCGSVIAAARLNEAKFIIRTNFFSFSSNIICLKWILTISSGNYRRRIRNASSCMG